MTTVHPARTTGQLSNGFDIYAWYEREGMLPALMNEWRERHNPTHRSRRRYVDGQSNEALLWRQSLDTHPEFDEELDYIDWMQSRKTWRVNAYETESKKGIKELNIIFRLVVAALNRSKSYTDIQQTLITVGYSQAAVDSIPMIPLDEYKRRETMYGMETITNDEWFAREEIEAYESENNTRLITLREVLNKLFPDESMEFLQRMRRALKSIDAAVTARLQAGEYGPTLTPLYDAATLTADKLRIDIDNQIKDEERKLAEYRQTYIGQQYKFSNRFEEIEKETITEAFFYSNSDRIGFLIERLLPNGYTRKYYANADGYIERINSSLSSNRETTK